MTNEQLHKVLKSQYQVKVESIESPDPRIFNIWMKKNKGIQKAGSIYIYIYNCSIITTMEMNVAMLLDDLFTKISINMKIYHIYRGSMQDLLPAETPSLNFTVPFPNQNVRKTSLPSLLF